MPQDLQLQINLLDDSHARILLQAQTVQLPEPLGGLTDLQLECAAAELTAARLDCRDGVLRLQSGRDGKQQIRRASATASPTSSCTSTWRDAPCWGGGWRLRGEVAAGGWQIDIEAERLVAATADDTAGRGRPALPRLEGGGELALTAQLQGRRPCWSRPRFSLRLQADSFTDADGSVAGEELDVTVTGDARAVAGGWRLNLKATRTGAAVCRTVVC